MKVGKIFKNIVITTCICSATLGVGEIILNRTTNTPNSIVAYAEERVKADVRNQQLKSKLLSLLGKKQSDTLYIDDFMVSDNYKPTTDTTDPINPAVTANRYCLDLSSTGITEISDLVQFEFPSTLKTIDLSNNGITQAHLDKILEVISINNTTTPIYHVDDAYFPRDLEVASNFSEIISKVNVGINNIDLKNIEADLDNKYAKFLFGIQNLPKLDSSGLINSTELDNTYYYVRSSVDDHYYQDLIIKKGYNQELQNIDTNIITQLINNDSTQISDILGRYSITWGNPTSQGNYFNSKHVFEFDLISINIDPDYEIERGDIFSLDINKNIVFNHYFPGDFKLETINTPSTIKVGIVDIKLKLTLLEDGRNRTFTVQAPVIDSLPPVLTLIGPEKIYISQNTEYTDEGAIAIDNFQKLDSGLIVVEGYVNTSVPETYKITYNCKDSAGNQAEEITRTVVVVKGKILDKINLSLVGDAIKGQKVTLEVSPRDNITVSDYKDFQYDVYQDGTKLYTIPGDKVTGKAQIPLTPLDDTTIKVVLTVTRVDNGEVLSIPPAEYRLELSAPPKDYTKLIIIAGSCVAFILLVVIIHAIKKSIKKKRTSQKEAKAKLDRDGKVEIVKDFTGEGVSKEFMEAMKNINTPSTIGQDPSTDPNRLGDLVDNIQLGEGDIPPNQVDNFGPLNPPRQQPMNNTVNEEAFIEDVSDTPPQNNNAIGRIDVAQVPSDQAINGGTHPEAGKPNNITNNFNNNSDDNGDIWI